MKTQDIPVKNLWLLLLYAFHKLEDKRLAPNKNMRWENPPEEICVLAAKLLVHEVEKRLRRQLNRDYTPTEAVLSRLRGRIDLLTTERRQLMQQGRIACRYHNFVVDTPRNRFVRAALDKSAALLTAFEKHQLAGVKDKVQQEAKEIAKRCRRQSRIMHEMGVLAPAPLPNSPELDNFGRHDMTDRPMVELAKFVFVLLMPTEDAGKTSTPDIGHRDDQWLRNLFELAVYGFFAIDSEMQAWEATNGTHLRWHADEQRSSVGAKTLLPRMQADIILHNHELDKRIVIDTKYTRLEASKKYEAQENTKAKSDHLYQIYSYIMSQHEAHPQAEGVLLYPAVENEVDEHTTIQDHRYRFMTVNLAETDSEAILDQLRSIVRSPQPTSTPS